MDKRTENVSIEQFEPYDFNKYGTPWVCEMEKGKYKFNFREKIGMYTAKPGKCGDLVVFHPVKNKVYGYGQRSFFGTSLVCFVKWDGSQFIPCDKFGNLI